MRKVTPLLVLATSAVLGAACARSSKSDPVGGGGPRTAAPAGSATGGDTHLAAREKFQDPGGMWMPRQMLEQAGRLAELGLTIDVSALADPTRSPLAAVVSLGGCTASFVSSEGLVITNHHCVQSALQRNSTPEDNLIENGFLARTRAEERHAGPAQRIRVAQKMTDVSPTLTAGLAEIGDPGKRHDELERREKLVLAQCEKGRPFVRCDVRSFFGGKEWQLIESLEIRDVRLVYVPHRAIGNYGGEIDNWAWPRHTGDFAFYRAYVGKDGKPADYSPANVPYHPAAHLEIQPAGIAPHDLVLVTGYPGKTNRNMTAAEMRHAAEWTHPHYVEKARQQMAVLAELQKQKGETAIKAGVARQFTQNGLEKYEGILEGIRKYDLTRGKEAAEKEFRTWAGRDPSRRRYVDALAAMALRFSEMWKAEAEEETWNDALHGSGLLGQALLLVKWSHEQQKSDADRELGYQERDRSLVVAGQKAFARRFDPAIDRALWRLTLVRAAADPASKSWLTALLALPPGTAVDEVAIDRSLERFYARTRLASEEVRLTLLRARPAELAKSRDPFIAAAVAMFPRVEAIKKRDDAWSAEMILLRPMYMEGLMARAGRRLVAPDANGTLRISFGTVRGYRPAPDKEAYSPFTTVGEIPAKNTGVEPFDAPAKLLDAIAAASWGPYAAPALGSVPADFLSDLDITGGNSGSPVLDGRGRLVGLAFDGNYEGLASDVVFRGESTRTISVDIRYVLWLADAVDKADHVIEELGIKPAL